MSTQQAWLPNTAYLVRAVVIPTVFAGYTWRATVAGTSAGTEPAWPDPTLGTTTIVDGGVTWSVGTGFRQEAQDGLQALVAAFAAANPTILRAVYGSRPRAFPETPCFFIGNMAEQVEHRNGVRTRTLAGFSAYVVDVSPEPGESGDRLAFLVDALTDLFTGGVHAISGRSVLVHTATLDTEVADGQNVIYPGAEFQFGQTSVAEGRN